METKRKLHLGAMAVIASGLVALTTLAPRVAVANPCASQTRCGVGCGTNLLSFCQSIALSGCTATSYQCLPPHPPIRLVTRIYSY